MIIRILLPPSEVRMEIRLTTLGTTGVTKGGRELASLPGKPVTFALLVYLALEGKVTRDKAASVFWPESDNERARANLSQTLYELKQELGEGWLARQGNFLLATESLWVDARAFQAHLSEGRPEEAVSLYRGHFLDGAFLAQTHPFEEWVEHSRGHLRRLHRDALEAFIHACRAKGDLSRALVLASGWVGLDPLCEAAQHNLIRLLAESGNREEALAQYDRYASVLDAELALEPLEETRDLVKGIRSGGLKPARRAPESLGTPSSFPPHPVAEAFNGNGVATRLRDRTELRRYLEKELAPRLEVFRPIGRGSMADVLLARDPALKVLVAVKVLSPELSANEEFRRRFRREAEAMAKLDSHPNVCGVKWADTLPNDLPYLVMPFIKGTTLAHRLKAEGRLSPGEVRIVMLEVASALAAAHRAGILHRDIRPDNILREDETGKTLLSDFGIAGILESGEFGGVKVTHTGEILGNPAYISPEQMEGYPSTDRSDVYSLGVTGYELLTGRPPPAEEAGTRKAGKLAASALEEYARSFDSMDKRLVELIIRCLARVPGHRPTAADIERRLKEDEREKALRESKKTDDISIFKLILQKRLPQIIGAYVAAGWMGVEIVQWLDELFHLPPAVEWLALVTLVAGFPAVSILGWFHGKKGRQAMPTVERWLLGGVALGWLAGVLWVVFHSPFP